MGGKVIKSKLSNVITLRPSIFDYINRMVTLTNDLCNMIALHVIRLSGFECMTLRSTFLSISNIFLKIVITIVCQYLAPFNQF